MIQVSLVGAAHIHTPGFVDRLKKRDDIKVKAVWDHDAERAKKNAQELGAGVVAEADHAISDPDLAAVIVCSETNRHEALVKMVAAPGLMGVILCGLFASLMSTADSIFNSVSTLWSVTGWPAVRRRSGLSARRSRQANV